MKEYYYDADKIKVREKRINYDTIPIDVRFWVVVSALSFVGQVVITLYLIIAAVK